MGDIRDGIMKHGTEENGIPETFDLVPEDKDAHKEGWYQYLTKLKPVSLLNQVYVYLVHFGTFLNFNAA